MNRYSRTLWVLLAAGICYTQPALPQSSESGSRSGWDRGLDSAVSRARERTGGRVLSAETREVNGRLIYFVRILTKDGKVKNLRTDAATGESMTPQNRR